jgi:hypothetical protein
MATRNGQAK